MNAIKSIDVCLDGAVHLKYSRKLFKKRPVCISFFLFLTSSWYLKQAIVLGKLTEVIFDARKKLENICNLDFVVM